MGMLDEIMDQTKAQENFDKMIEGGYRLGACLYNDLPAVVWIHPEKSTVIRVGPAEFELFLRRADGPVPVDKLELVVPETPDYVHTYHEYWRSIVENDEGELKRDAVMRELYDYRQLLSGLPKLYDRVTGGRISKVTTSVDEVLRCYEEFRGQHERQDLFEDVCSELCPQCADGNVPFLDPNCREWIHLPDGATVDDEVDSAPLCRASNFIRVMIGNGYARMWEKKETQQAAQ